MCRYSYRSGACANRHVESLECVGEENCLHSGANIMTRKSRASMSNGCGLDRWMGLYCEKHGRFFCPGKDGCETPESYMHHFNLHQQTISRKGPMEE